MLSSEDNQSALLQTRGCFFASDLHGQPSRYHKLFNAIVNELPTSIFLGGDILPSHLLSLKSAGRVHRDFVSDFLIAGFLEVRQVLGKDYPRVLLILGNDDLRAQEPMILAGEERGLWEYVHNRRVALSGFSVFGYAYVPPTPFLLKDWERYDVSRFADPGCIHPEEGWHSVPVSGDTLRYATIKEDLDLMVEGHDLSRAIFLFHAPPYDTRLDRAALDGRTIEHVPLDVHVGSIAVRRFIESYQPYMTLHGHVHESARMTGSWKDRIGNTIMFSAAHDGPELALIRFDLDKPESGERELI